MNLIYNVFLTSSLVLIPIFNPSPVEVYQSSPVATSTPVIQATMPKVARKTQNTTLTPSQVQISKKVETILGKELVAIAYCESKFKQFNSKGEPLISRTSDVGVMQINQVHWKRAKSLGLDIFYSTNDNIIMGKIILDEQGKKAWTCSRILAKSG